MQPANSPFSPFDFAKVLASVAESGSRVGEEWQAIAKPVLPEQMQQSIPDNISKIWHLYLAALHADPQKLCALQKRFAEEQQRLLSLFSPSMPAGNNTNPVTDPATFLSAKDQRFNTPSWQNPVPFHYLAESYLAGYQLLFETIETLDLPAAEKTRLRFFAKQYADAISPANFLFTNPDALKAAVESNGETLRAGLENLQADINKGHISLTDESVFEVGKNMAVTPGAVVFENEIFQLLQYTPQTAEVHLRPLLIVPPCINKFYILDLRPGHSYIEYAVQQGFTVFVISWRNVGEEQRALTWDNYLADGVIKAIDVARIIANVHKINVLGFCVGGTILASAVAALKRMGHDVVESMTLLTTFLDFSEVGEISAYVDEAFVARREREVGAGGILNGGELAMAFSSLRANDLIWHAVANNYLQGKKPPAFDLLFWNSDSTNLPGPWYCYYLRNTYFENNLVKPDKLIMCGVPIDLGTIDMPAFVFAAKEDHIVPWRTAYSSAQYLGSNALAKVTFVLGASGHIAGVVNPASKNKRSYWLADKAHSPQASVENWQSHAVEHQGSWWPRWSKWLQDKSGKMIPARHKLGNTTYPVIEAAPGSYVKVKAGKSVNH